jgi:secreted trypsin-like serine protease
MKMNLCLQWGLSLLLLLSGVVDSKEYHRNLQQRIIGGFKANQARYPYYTFLRIITGGGRFYYCGGTLVAEDMVLSAAHCVMGIGQVTQIVAWVNHTTSGDVEFTRYEYERQATRRIRHPSYNNRTMANDLVLIKLDYPVKGVALPRMNSDEYSPVDGQSLTVFGFGLTSNPGRRSDSLMEVAVNTVSHQDCKDENSHHGRI